MTNFFLLGAIAMAAAVAGLIFLRYYKRTGDLFFLFFAASFLLQSAGYILSSFLPLSGDQDEGVFFIRFLGYALILVAIYYKNYSSNR